MIFVIFECESSERLLFLLKGQYVEFVKESAVSMQNFLQLGSFHISRFLLLFFYISQQLPNALFQGDRIIIVTSVFVSLPDLFLFSSIKCVADEKSGQYFCGSMTRGSLKNLL